MSIKARSSSFFAGVSASLPVSALLATALLASAPQPAAADEGGVSFWLPGQYGSLAATPLQPGWSLASIYYHTSIEGGGQVAASREITIGRFKPTLNVNLTAHLNASADLGLFDPTYVFASPVLGGQLAVEMIGMVGRSDASVDAALTATLGPLAATRFYSVSDSVTGFGDLYPRASLRWNQGVHNYMIYAMGDIPVGAYDSTRLANLGIGHGAFDGGFGYTYFNPQTGNELSAVTGLTYNFTNPDTDYRNGLDWHLDWGISHFISKQMHIGAVGYVFQQLTADSGALPVLGEFKSRVIGVGPQVGFMFPVGTMQGYLNFKGYKEFEHENRPAGWNAWVTFVISPVAPASIASPRPLVAR